MQAAVMPHQAPPGAAMELCSGPRPDEPHNDQWPDPNRSGGSLGPRSGHMAVSSHVSLYISSVQCEKEVVAAGMLAAARLSSCHALIEFCSHQLFYP